MQHFIRIKNMNGIERWRCESIVYLERTLNSFRHSIKFGICFLISGIYQFYNNLSAREDSHSVYKTKVLDSFYITRSSAIKNHWKCQIAPKVKEQDGCTVHHVPSIPQFNHAIKCICHLAFHSQPHQALTSTHLANSSYSKRVTIWMSLIVFHESNLNKFVKWHEPFQTFKKKEEKWLTLSINCKL